MVVLRALGLGDLLVATPALRALARAFPEHRRALVAPAWLGPLVGMLGGAVTDITHADFRERVGTVPVRAGDADVAVNLHGCGPESHRALLDSGSRQLIAFAHPDVRPSRGAPSWDDHEHEMARWCRLLEAHGIAADPSDWRLDPGEPPPRPSWREAVVLHPGAASLARRWPPERWAEVARDLAGEGRKVLLTGTAEERPLCLRIAEEAGLGPGLVTAGRTGLTDLAHGLSQAALLVSGDTGVAHLGTALRVPSVLLFGPTPPQRWGPPPDQDGRHVVLWAGRTGDPRASVPDAGLLEIEPADVLRAASDAVQPATT